MVSKETEELCKIVRGFEGVKYYVHEVEDEFSFYCEKIEYWYI